MKKSKLLGGAVAACAVALFAGAASAASVTLPGWAFGSGNAIGATVGGHAVQAHAGGFGGVLAGAGNFDTASFITYCIELEESFYFSTTAMTGYQLVEGATYFAARRAADASRPDGALVADRLGRLLTYLDDNPGAVDTALESTAMQLAIWNIVYDADSDVRFSTGGAFAADKESTKKYAVTTHALLAGAAGVAASRFEVFALARAGSQDFLLARETTTAVSEPATAALAALALAGLLGGRRRRAASDAA